jgi:outer membrane protein OmpA-like peptidoglycan-associated protein
VLLPSSYSYLDEVAAAIVDNGYHRLRIDAHVSNEFGDRAQKITDQRAAAVRAYLVDKAGVDPDKLETKGYGDTSPIAPNLTDMGRKMNSRVTFTITKR